MKEKKNEGIERESRTYIRKVTGERAEERGAGGRGRIC